MRRNAELWLLTRHTVSNLLDVLMWNGALPDLFLFQAAKLETHWDHSRFLLG